MKAASERQARKTDTNRGSSDREPLFAATREPTAAALVAISRSHATSALSRSLVEAAPPAPEQWSGQRSESKGCSSAQRREVVQCIIASLQQHGRQTVCWETHLPTHRRLSRRNTASEVSQDTFAREDFRGNDVSGASECR